jgi:hypothetical protein
VSLLKKETEYVTVVSNDNYYVKYLIIASFCSESIYYSAFEHFINFKNDSVSCIL